jgi:hypothetical protein
MVQSFLYIALHDGQIPQLNNSQNIHNVLCEISDPKMFLQ